MMFADRLAAGQRLADAAASLAGPDVVVVGLPRGGVPVAGEIARALRAPIDVIVVCKLGVPGRPELAMGAVGEGGVQVVNADVVRAAGVSPEQFARVEGLARAEVERRAARFRGDRAPVVLAGRSVLVVDDGIATGATARAACQIVREHGAARVVLAVPVGPPAVIRDMRDVADEVLCLHAPARFGAVGQFYADFAQTTDEEVRAALRRAGGRQNGT